MFGKQLRRREVQPAPTMLRAAAHQVHVLAVHPHHQRTGSQVFSLLGTSRAIDRQSPRGGSLRMSQGMSPPVPLDGAGSGAVTQPVPARGSAWGLQPHEHADRLQQRGLALCVPPREHREPGMHFHFRLLKAAEITELQPGKHRPRCGAEGACPLCASRGACWKTGS